MKHSSCAVLVASLCAASAFSFGACVSSNDTAGGDTGTGGSVSTGGSTSNGGGGTTGGAGKGAGGMTGGAGKGAGGMTGGAGTSAGGTTGGAGASAGGTTGGAGASAGGHSSGGAGNDGASGQQGAAGKNNPMSFSPCPTDGSPCRVMPLGDSITEGAASSTGGGYRIELFHRALQGGKNITFVGSGTSGPDMVDGQPFPKSHEGHGGYTIDNNSQSPGISPLTPAALMTYQPHVVTLMIGTNDIGLNVDIANAPTRLGNLIDTITTIMPDTLVLVATIIPRQDDPSSQWSASYNEAIPGLVSTRAQAGKHVVLVDNHAAFVANPNWASEDMGDVVHPNDAGHIVLGDSWFEVLKAYLP